MTREELLKIIKRGAENESVEFKDSKNYSAFGGKEKTKKCLYGYCVGMGNAGGGQIIFGVTDTGNIVGTTSFPNLQEIREKLYGLMEVKVHLEEFFLEVDNNEKRIVVATVLARNPGTLFRFFGKYLSRVGEQLVEMTEDEIKQVFREAGEDFSARFLDLGIDVLDTNALKSGRELYKKKNIDNANVDRLSDEQFLKDLGLIKDGRINNTALLIFGKKEVIDEYQQNAEIIYEYRTDPSSIKYSDRVNFREPLVFSLNEIWNKIDVRNYTMQINEGLLRKDIRAFNETVIRESLLNAVIHRDYLLPGSIFVQQDNTQITFKNPGGLLAGITIENIFKKSEWRNRRLAETFEKLGLVERSGQGVDLIYDKTIKEGKGLPDYSNTSSSEVVLGLPAIIKDEEFVTYLEEVCKKMQINFSVQDLIFLEKIKEGNIKNITKRDVSKFVEKGIVVSIGRGRGTKYLLSKEYYKNKDMLGVYTRIEGLKRDKIKEMVVEHIHKNGSVSASEVKQAFPELTAKDIENIFQELRKAGRIHFEGHPRTGKWLLGQN